MTRLQFKAVLLGAFVSVILLNTARGDRFLSIGSLHGGIKKLERIVEEEYRNGEIQKENFHQKNENGDDLKEEEEGMEDIIRKRRETGDLVKKNTNKKDNKMKREGKKEKKKKTGTRNVSIKEKEKKNNSKDAKINKLVGKKHTNRNLKENHNPKNNNKLGKKHGLKSDSKRKNKKKSKKGNGRNSGDVGNRKGKKPRHKNLKSKKKKTNKNKERKVLRNPKKDKQVKEDKKSKMDDKSGKQNKRKKSSRRQFSKNKFPKYETENGKKTKNRAGRGSEEEESEEKEEEESEEKEEESEEKEEEEGTVLYERGRSNKKRKPQHQKLLRMNGGQIVTSSQCGETFTLGYEESAILLSINDGNKAKCNQIFQSPLGTTISLDCPQFNLNFNGCRREKMFVFPGIGGKKKSKFCDVDLPSLTTPSNNLEIRYRRKRVKRRECSGGYVCIASVNGERPTTLNELPITPAFTTPVPTTLAPTTLALTTLAPTTLAPTTLAPTTLAPTTLPPTTLAPTTLAPTTLAPTTLAPTTLAPTTLAPTTLPPTTLAPTTLPPTTLAPTTLAPTTLPPTTLPPTTPATTTPATTTPATTTPAPTTPAPTTTTPTTTPNPTTKLPGAPVSTRLYCDTCGTAAITVPRIVGGEEATISEYPWQVIIRVNAAGFASPIQCGGSIIKKFWILSAAHCFVDPDTYTEFTSISITVTVREHDLDQTTELTSIDFPQANLFVHPQYKQDVNNRDSEEHDIALLSLGSEVPFETGILPICMPTSQDFKADQDVVVAGWGLTTFNGDAASQLQEVTLKSLTYSECETLNTNAPETYFISNNMICAIAPSKDSCQGDSGGPLVTQAEDGRWVQLGIVSFGYQCAFPDVPGFYTNVANYTDWITETTGSSQC